MTTPALLLLLTLELGAAPSDAPLNPQVSPQYWLVQSRAKWIAVTGAAVALGGVALWGTGIVQQRAADRSPAALVEVQSARDNAQHNLLGGIGLTVVGACILGWAGVMWVTAPPALLIAPVPGGGAMVFSGTLP